jgi:hypothetical protein
VVHASLGVSPVWVGPGFFGGLGSALLSLPLSPSLGGHAACAGAQPGRQSLHKSPPACSKTNTQAGRQALWVKPRPPHPMVSAGVILRAYVLTLKMRELGKVSDSSWITQVRWSIARVSRG